MYVFTITFFLLLAWHAIADYPLQGPYLSEAKNRHTTIGKDIWKWALPSHGLIHGAGVTLITGSLLLGLLEVVCHCYIDYLKNEGDIDFNTDQTYHVICKLVWAVTVYATLPLPTVT